MKVRKLERRGIIRWIADLGIVGDHRMQKTFATEDEAKGWLASKRDERKRLGDAALALPDAKRLEYLAAETRLGGVATIGEAVEFFLKYREAIVPRTIGAAITERVEAMRLEQCRQVSIDGNRRDLGLLFRGREQSLVSELTLADLQAAITRGDPAPSTQRSRTITIRAFMSFCAERKYVLENIGQQLKRPALDSGPPRILTVKQVVALFKTAAKSDPDLAANLALVAFGGVRPTEATRLPQGCIGARHIQLSSDRTKTRQRRLIEITPCLRAWLRVGDPFKVQNFYNRLLAVRTASGCPWWQDVLRHSFCSYALPVHGAKWTSEQAGHSEDILYRHYRELVTPAEAKKYWAIRP